MEVSRGGSEITRVLVPVVAVTVTRFTLQCRTGRERSGSDTSESGFCCTTSPLGTVAENVNGATVLARPALAFGGIRWM